MALTVNVNVADQGFPPPPPTFQNLPENLGVLVSGGVFAGPLALLPPQALPLFSQVAVADLAEIPPSFAQGFFAPESPDVFVDDEIPSNPIEFIVTEVGNFQTNPTPSQVITVTITAVTDADTGGAISPGTSNYKIALNTKLTQFGLSFIGRIMTVLTSGTAANVDQVRTINFWNVNLIYVSVSEENQSFSNVTPPAPGDTLAINSDRQGDEVVYQLSGIDVSAFPSTQSPPAFQDPVQAAIGKFLGNFQAKDGVVFPFIGKGQQLPPFIGTFEVEDQPVAGSGLPVNVFV